MHKDNAQLYINLIQEAYDNFKYLQSKYKEQSFTE